MRKNLRGGIARTSDPRWWKGCSEEAVDLLFAFFHLFSLKHFLTKLYNWHWVLTFISSLFSIQWYNDHFVFVCFFFSLFVWLFFVVVFNLFCVLWHWKIGFLTQSFIQTIFISVSQKKNLKYRSYICIHLFCSNLIHLYFLTINAQYVFQRYTFKLFSMKSKPYCSRIDYSKLFSILTIKWNKTV